jgi:hypothetical protein
VKHPNANANEARTVQTARAFSHLERDPCNDDSRAAEALKMRVVSEPSVQSGSGHRPLRTRDAAMRMQTLAFVLLILSVSTAARADVIKDNLNYSMTATPPRNAADDDCRKWTAAPIKFDGGEPTVDVGRLAILMVANAAASHWGPHAYGPNPHACNRRAPQEGP